jgi:sugar lactone lactonase YvrE
VTIRHLLVKERCMPDLRLLLNDIAMGESPRWNARDGRFWFADWGTQEIIALDRAGTHEVILRDLGALPLCFDWQPDGRLLLVSGRDGLLLRQEPDGSLVTHAELRPLATTPWNEIVVDGRGNVYLNNTGFDFPGGAFAPGFIALVTPDGTLRPVASDVAFPNGMAVTPDNRTLIVAESYASRLTAFDIAADGDLANRRVWAEIPGSAPDGICLDAEGAVWYADVPNRCCVRVREGGEILQMVELDRGGFACMLGGPQRRTLAILANDWHGPEQMNSGARSGRLLALDVAVAGAGWP